MPDREKVIKGLTACVDDMCDYCPYYDEEVPDCDYYGRCNRIDMNRDALAILTDTTTWIKEPNRRNHWHCEKCGYVEGLTAWMHKYCPDCGRRVTGEIEYDG